jgi:hypothetical protein
VALPSPSGANPKPVTGRAGSPAEPPALGIAVMSPWGWRILTVFAMVALGLCLTFFIDAKTTFGALWAVVALGWGGFSLKLWRDHLAWDKAAGGRRALVDGIRKSRSGRQLGQVRR